MTSQQLEAFLAIVAHGSFNKAAQSLYLSQPAITHRIRQLERELDVTLFCRSDFSLCSPLLTQAGSIFLKKARAFQALYKSTQTDLLPYRQNKEFTLGCIHYMLDGNSTVFFHIVQKIAGELSVTIKPLPLGKPSGQKAQLLSGEVDLLFTDLTAPAWQEAVFGKAELFQSPIYACLHRSHPLAQKNVLTPADLQNEPLCCVEDNSFFPDFIHTHLSGSQYAWSAVHCGSLAEALALLTPQQGLMLTNVKNSIVSQLTYLPVCLDAASPVGIVWVKKRATPLLHQLIKAICDLPQNLWRT